MPDIGDADEYAKREFGVMLMKRKAKFQDAEDDELLNSKNMSEDSVDIHRDDYRKLIKTIKT